MRALSPHGSGSGCFLAPSWTMSDDDSGRKPGHVVPWKTPWCDTVRLLVSISRTAIVHSCSSVNQLLQPPQKFRGGILAQLVKTNLSLVSTEEHLMRLYTILIIHFFFWSVLSCILLLISCWGGLSPATIISGEYHNYLLPCNYSVRENQKKCVGIFIIGEAAYRGRDGKKEGDRELWLQVGDFPWGWSEWSQMALPNGKRYPHTDDSTVATRSQDHLRCSTQHLMTAVSLHFVITPMTMESVKGSVAPQLLGNKPRKEQNHSKTKNVFKHRISLGAKKIAAKHKF